jgi:hypothetical protein
MKLVIDGDYWDQESWSEAEIEISIVDDDSVRIELWPEDVDGTPILLKIKTLEWAIKTLLSSPDGDNSSEEGRAGA